MSATTIITTTTSSRPERGSRFKAFLNEHCHVVDFLSASITICLCLTILLPRVHESFLQPAEDHHGSATKPGASQTDPTDGPAGALLPTAQLQLLLPPPPPPPPPPNQTVLVGAQDAAHQNYGHQHNHNHHFPAGELLICIGFFVFYCTGLGLARPRTADYDLYLARLRKQSTTSCCTSSRCPAPNIGDAVSQGDSVSQLPQPDQDELAAILPPDANMLQQQVENDCLMLLNRHHQHHTHSKYHEHSNAPANLANNHSTNNNNNNFTKHRRRPNYGSTQPPVLSEGANYHDLTQDDKITVAPKPNTTIVVDEIRITSGPDPRNDQWPHSLRLLLFTIILALILIFFDMNVLGIRAVKVFRATSTGALLYVAFFIMLPQKSANCSSCREEEM